MFHVLCFRNGIQPTVFEKVLLLVLIPLYYLQNFKLSIRTQKSCPFHTLTCQWKNSQYLHVSFPDHLPFIYIAYPLRCLPFLQLTTPDQSTQKRTNMVATTFVIFIKCAIKLISESTVRVNLRYNNFWPIFFSTHQVSSFT